MMVFFVFVEGLVASIRYKERFRWNDTINRYVNSHSFNHVGPQEKPLAALAPQFGNAACVSRSLLILLALTQLPFASNSSCIVSFILVSLMAP